jgi:Ca-activated chloride channel family protein
LGQNLYWLKIAGLGLLIIAMARPQSGATLEEVTTEGIDIMLVLDVSTSMLAEDFKPNNRLQAAKLVAKEFIEGRRNDPIGLVIFAREAFSQCPLTLDYGVLIDILQRVEVASEAWDGTAIGNGLATAVARLKDSNAKSKVIIMLTDGENNAGEIDPVTAAQVAQTFGIRVYTIGAGTRGTAMYPFSHPLFGKQYRPIPVEIDEDLLTRIADITGGKYFRATDTDKLREIYHQIDELEKTKIEVKEYTKYTELYIPYVLAGLLILLLEMALRNTVLRKLP